MARITAVSKGSWEFVSKEQIAENNERNDDGDVDDEDDDWVSMYDDDYDDLTRKLGSSSKLFTDSLNTVSKGTTGRTGLSEFWNRKLMERFSSVKTICKDRSDRATAEQVLDKRTLLILRRLMQRDIFDKIEGCVSTGKEANVYHALTGDGKSLAVKVYKTSILIFRDRDRYVSGEFRYRHGYSKHNPRKMITVWAEKEMRNLSRMHSVGLPVPKPVIVKQNVVVMDFIGADGWPAALLKDAELSHKLADTLYIKLVDYMRKIYRDCRLVHADLSEYNIMVKEGKLYIIDVSQSVEHDHPRSLEFLRSDCSNVTKFFRSRGVSVLSTRDLFLLVADPSIKTESQLQELMSKRTSETPADDALFMNAFIAQKLEQVLYFERDQQITKAGGEIPNPFQMMISQVRCDEDQSIDEGNEFESDELEDQRGLNQYPGSIELSISGEKERKNRKVAIYIRSRDESPNTKKERKRLVKEEKRASRLTKIPKHIKKRHNKTNKC
ncbi:atypical/RIO/RIO1 protein kinase [Loa loa]|uniref:Serine/threonine-protein kinase RIO1 n=1 Tax=Loa loa TaxID=7209 RepID=A0A1I7VVD5_LOALO|nr:atypical/RIO/RIO1 protein kinase [Loa loa]EFO28395.2 atypical/RIO/RIO1 protein kinase [Loa loa]